jgi:L-fuconolactonase
VVIDSPIVDTHLHIWDTTKINYPWLPDVPMLNRPHLIDEYRDICGPVEVEKMVFVQAEADFAEYQKEADWVSEVAATKDNRIQGIVAWAPLEKGKAAESALATLTEDPLVKGIRRIIQFEPDLEFCLRPDFVEGVRLLPSFGLRFDICINHIHMENTIAFVEQCPDVSFILDHIGKPDIKNHVTEPWKTHLKTLAGFDNVHCKMSGLATEADFENWSREDFRPYMDHVMDCFGVDRVMFGGDWPVASQAIRYPEWVETLEWGLSGLSEADLRKIFRENAIAFYGLA